MGNKSIKKMKGTRTRGLGRTPRTNLPVKIYTTKLTSIPR